MAKVIVVIGGTGGIGFSVCEMFVKNGFKVYLVGRDKKLAIRQAKKISPLVIPEIADVLKEKSLVRLFNLIWKENKRIDAVVNLAGIFEPFGEFEKVNLKKHFKVLELNLFGSFNVAHTILPIFKKQGFGKIIFFSGGGIGGDIPLVNASSYYTSKGAISIFTEVLGKELEKNNIQINSILPGQILTKLTKKTFKISSKKLGPVLGPATQSLKEVGGNSVGDVLKLINFLIEDKSSHITGRTLSAKWDSLEILMKKISGEMFKLRRVDGKFYKRSGSG